MLVVVSGNFFIFSLIQIYFLIKSCECYNYNNNENNNNKIASSHNYEDQVEVFDHRINYEREHHGDTVDRPEFLPSPQPQTQVPCTFEREGTSICNCGYIDEELVLPKFSGQIFQIILLNCKRIRLQEGTFSDLPHISWVRFHNIEQLVLEEKSLQFGMRDPRSRVQLEFINVVIEDFNSYVISGNIEQIRLEKCKIGAIHPFAVTGIRNKMFRLSIVDTTINFIEPQAFKKFSVEEMEIINSTFGSDIPSRSFYDIDVTQNLRIRDTKFVKIHSSAFVFQEVSSFSMIGNYIEQLNGEAIQMQIRDSIMIRNNTIASINSGAFRKIVLDANYFSRNSEPMPFNFIENYLSPIGGPQNIEFNNLFNLRISQLFFTTQMSCDGLENLRANQFFVLHSDTLYFRMVDDDDEGYLRFSYILGNRCIEESYLIYIIIGVSILVIILFLIAVITICLCIRRRRSRKMNIIMPEGKTYRETQIVMQIENHGLLKTDL